MTRRLTVEECFDLDVFALTRCGYLEPGATGSWWWEVEGKERGRVYLGVTAQVLHLLYFLPDSQGRSALYHHLVYLQRSSAAIGRERVLFICPGCGRRAAKLYRPPDRRDFRCRDCYGLSYRSRQVRLPRWARDLERLTRLQNKEKGVDVTSPRGYRLNRQIEKLEESLEKAGVFRAMDAFKIVAERPPAPPRGPGRPSKKEKRAQAQAEQAAVQAARPKRPRGRPKTKRSYTRHVPFVLSERKTDGEAYCVKCRDRREMEDPRLVTLPNGRPALQGTCSCCQTTITRIVKASEAEALKATLPE